MNYYVDGVFIRTRKDCSLLIEECICSFEKVVNQSRSQKVISDGVSPPGGLGCMEYLVVTAVTELLS